MKRLFAASAVILFFCGGGLVLLWLGNYFISYASTRDSLSVKEPTPKVLSLGTKMVIDLHGSGFNQKTTASLFMDVNNSKAIIGSVPLEGFYRESLIYGDYLYLAPDNGGLQVLDIKEPHQPKLFKEYLVGRSIIDIKRSGTYLYLSCGKLGVSIMQIQQDGFLQHVADIAVESHATSCEILHDDLFVAGGKGGLLIYDVRQPEKVFFSRVLMPGSVVSKIVVVDDFLYLLVEKNRLEIYQLTKKQTPSLVGFLQLSEDPYDLVAHRQHLYIASEAGVSLYSLEVPQKPALLRQWGDLGFATKLFAELEHVYISDNFSGLRAVAADEEEPSAYISLNIDLQAISETADYLYVAGSNSGLLIVDKSRLSSRQKIQTIDTPGSAYDLFIKEKWIYIADARGGVLLQNLDGKGESPIAVTSRWGESLVENGDLLFVAQAKMGIEIIDISDPGNPESVAVWPDLESRRLAISGHYLLSSKGASGLDLIDFSDIQSPLMKNILSDVHVLDVTTEGQFVYVASKDEGLLIYKLVANEKLSRLGRLQTPFPMNKFDLAVSVQVHDGIAYVANGRSGLLIVDVKKPRKPTILSSIAVPGICKTVEIFGHKAFVVSHHGGVSIINIKDPERPIMINSISMPGLSRGLQVVDDLIYVAQRGMGVAVVPVPVQAEAIKVLSKERMRITVPSPTIPGSYSLRVENQRESVVSDGVVEYQ